MRKVRFFVLVLVALLAIGASSVFGDDCDDCGDYCPDLQLGASTHVAP